MEQILLTFFVIVIGVVAGNLLTAEITDLIFGTGEDDNEHME